MVTLNLESALRNIRCKTAAEKGRQAPLWIDAICINQEDVDERDEQVRRMKAIYQGADQVLIWLGDYDEPSDKDALARVQRRLVASIAYSSPKLVTRALTVMEVITRDLDSPIEASMKRLHVESLTIVDWLQLLRIFHRPWFERLWVIQELAVSTQAVGVWGRTTVPWKDLEKVADFILRPNKNLITTEVRQLLPWIGAQRMTQVDLQSMPLVQTKNILTILHNTQNAKCTDPRDRLFAILGIVEDSIDVEIDYSIPVEKVYRDWAWKRIRRTKTLDILTACADSRRSGDLPSWVPDLRKPFGQNKALWIDSQFGDNGCRPRKLELLQSEAISFSADGRRVLVKGIYSSSITSLSVVGDGVTGYVNSAREI